ncbi:MAG: hypothetical protein ACK5JC_08785 [Bacteroidota bacterium]
MLNIKIIFSFMLLSIIFFACHNTVKEESSIPVSDSANHETESVVTNKDSLIGTIDANREKIEALTVKAIELSTKGMREKIKQKWSKMHFYVQDGMIVKIKTYPYENISTRTEEFYANADGLQMAVIEDHGEGPKGEAKEKLDKIYYFDKGVCIGEQKNNEENEYNIKHSDSEELFAEYNEYLEIFRNYETKKK